MLVTTVYLVTTLDDLELPNVSTKSATKGANYMYVQVLEVRYALSATEM